MDGIPAPGKPAPPVYGPDQEVLLFEELAPVYRPDWVLLALYLDNDFEDILYGHLFEVHGDRLIRVPLSDESSPKYRYYKRQSFVQTFPGYRWFMEHSHLMNLIRRRWSRLEFGRVFPTYTVDQDREEQTWRVLRLLLLNWAQRTREAGIQPALLLIPSRDDVAQDTPSRNARRADRLLAFGREQAIPVLDSRGPLRGARSKSTSLYYPKDGHLTVEGHKVIAGYLSNVLPSLGFLHDADIVSAAGK